MAPRACSVGWLLLLLSLLFPAAAQAGIISVGRSAHLQFGRMVVLGNSGTIMISTTGARTVTGGVHLVSGGTVTPGTFVVTGTNNSSYRIVLPANNTVIMSYRGSQIRLSNFTCSVPLTGRLPGKTMTFTVGATGTITAHPSFGTYQGSFTVTVN